VSPRGGWSYIKRVNRVSVTVEDNWGNGGRNFTRTVPFDKLAALMSTAEVQQAREQGRLVESQDGTGFFLRVEPVPEPAADAPDPARAGDAKAGDSQDQQFEALNQVVQNGGVQVVCAPSLFPTPENVAAWMVDLADIRPEHRVLEPSAGTGNLVRAIDRAAPGCEIQAVELSVELARTLARLFGYPETVREGYTVMRADFLKIAVGELGQFDRVVMNPPFDHGADILHIKRAIRMLKPGGRLVAVCANGPRQQDQLKGLADEWIELEPGTFEGTNVRAAIMTYTASRSRGGRKLAHIAGRLGR